MLPNHRNFRLPPTHQSLQLCHFGWDEVFSLCQGHFTKEPKADAQEQGVCIGAKEVSFQAAAQVQGHGLRDPFPIQFLL